MIRKYPTPDLILSADWHLREDTPICHTGDFQKEQWDAMRFISNLQKEYGCPVICSGDLFHHWKPSPELLSKASIYMPKEVYAVYGNHDLPQHNMDLSEKSGFYNLAINGKISRLDEGSEIEGCSWNETPLRDTQFNRLEVVVWHIMVYQGKLPWPGCTDPMAAKLLMKYPEYKLIVTGDNHKTFVEEYKGRLLVNPGSLTRQTSAQVNHKPCVFLYYAATNTVKPVYLPIEQGVINREHMEKAENKDERIASFISKLNTGWKAARNFEETLKAFKQENEVSDSVMSIIYKAIE